MLQKLLVNRAGFTIIELLATVVVAILFTSIIFQLFSVSSQSGVATRKNTIANDIALKLLSQYPTTQSITGSAACPATPINQSFINQTASYIGKYDYTINFSCPYSSTPSITRIIVTLDYLGNQQARQVTYVN